MLPTSYMKFFETEREIYIQNISTGQVSMQFGSGPDAMSFTLPRKRDPIILTNHIPFEKIKTSMEFRRMLARQPAIIKLMSDEEFQSYYTVKAVEEKVSPESLIAKAEHVLQTQKQMPVDAPKSETAAAAEELMPVSEESVVHPKVIHLCHQASDVIPDADRMKGPELLSELKDIAEEFKMDDFEYILAHVKFKSINTWALQQQKALVSKAAV